MSVILSRVLMVACAALALLAGWQWLRAVRAESALSDYRNQVLVQINEATTKARAEEQRRAKTIQEALDAEVIARQAVEADARGVVAARGRLQQRVAELAASCSAPDPAAATGGTSAPSAGDLLADMLGRVAAAAGELGSYADRARVAGQTCERAYDGLTPR